MSYASSAHAFLRLLQPSWHGGLFTILFGVVTVGILFVPLFYDGSWADLYFDTAKKNNTVFYTDYSQLSSAVESSDFAGDVAVFVVWSLAGLAIYFVLASILETASHTFRFIQLLEYFKSDRQRLGVEALVRLTVRLSALVGVYLLYTYAVSDIVPFIIYATHKSLHAELLPGILYLLLAGVLLSLTAHVLVILMRIMLLKYRIFRSNSDSIIG
jgi:hypothetical protein